MNVIHEARVDVRPEYEVGVIQEGTKAETNLRFRDACNKVIHAKTISFGMTSLSDQMTFLDGTVELHGDWQGRDWVATIRLADFIRMAVRQL